MRARHMLMGAAVIVALVPATASAAPSSTSGSCPAATSGWTWMTVQQAAQTIFDGLVDQPDFGDFLAEIGGYDANGNGNVCLAIRAQQNQQAHYFGTPFFIVKDDNTGVA